MKLRRRLTRTAAVGLGSLAIIIGTAVPALAMHKTTNYGVAGYVHSTYNDTYGSIEGGVCGVDGPGGETWCPYSRVNQDQIYINQFRAYSAPYNTSQLISAKAYAYAAAPGQPFSRVQTTNLGSCGPAAGNGAQYCPFGYQAPDEGGGTNAQPIFYPLNRGFHWTVVIRVTWYNYNTGNALAQADYRPSTTADLGCAQYAQRQGRCSGPYTSDNTTYIYMG